MKEGLATEHSTELIRYTLEQLLNAGVVADERRAHLQTARGYVTDGRLHVVWDPLNEVRAVLVLNIQHLIVDLYGWRNT